MDFFPSAASNVTAFFSSNPSVIFVQACMLFCGFLVVFFVLFSTRDILLRSNSFLVQLACILLVAALPFVGFFLYLLIRPSQTNAQRKMQRDVVQILAKLNALPMGKRPQQQAQQQEKGGKKQS